MKKIKKSVLFAEKSLIVPRLGILSLVAQNAERNMSAFAMVVLLL